jgi:hypothetical protein
MLPLFFKKKKKPRYKKKNNIMKNKNMEQIDNQLKLKTRK